MQGDGLRVLVEISVVPPESGLAIASTSADSKQELPPAIVWLVRVLGAKPEFLYMRHPNPWVLLLVSTAGFWLTPLLALLINGPLAYGHNYWHPIFLPVTLATCIIGTLVTFLSLRVAPEDTMLRSPAGPLLALVCALCTITSIGPLVEAGGTRVPYGSEVIFLAYVFTSCMVIVRFPGLLLGRFFCSSAIAGQVVVTHMRDSGVHLRAVPDHLSQ